MKTIFERNLEESFKRMEKVQGTPLLPIQMIQTFFPIKLAEPIAEARAVPNRKTALVLVGKSGYGKSTYAINYQKKHPEFTIISMDECAYEDIRAMTNKERKEYLNKGADRTLEIGNRRFGKKLEEGKPNIIVDGGWLPMNARGGLLKTLTELNYHTIVICMLAISDEEIVKRTLRRDLNLLAMKLLGEENIMECIGRDFVKEYADSRHITVQEAKKEIRNESKRKRDIEEVKIAMAFEEIESMYAEQLESGLYFAGADQIVFPTNF